MTLNRRFGTPRWRGTTLILIDTHVLLWWQSEPRRLSPKAAAALKRARGSDGVAVAAISLWELAWLLRQGKIAHPGTLQAAIEGYAQGLAVLPLTAEIAAVGAQFGPGYPHDPADRIIGATALVAGLALVTRDEKIRASGLVPTIW